MPDIKLTWDGGEYVIKETDAFAVAEELEDHTGIFEISDMLRDQKNVKFRKIASWYSVLLNFAGAQVTPKQVHKAFMDHFHSVTIDDGDANKEKVAKTFEKMRVANEALLLLLHILMGDAPKGEAEGDTEGNAGPPAL